MFDISPASCTRRSLLAAMTAVLAAPRNWAAAVFAQQSETKKFGYVPPELLAEVHPAARYKRIPLADKDNALPVWLEAAKAYVELPADAPDEAFDALSEVKEEGGTFPRGAKGAVIVQWLSDNQRAAALISAGLKRKRFQFPDMRQAADFGDALDTAFADHFQLAYVKLVTAKYAITKRNFRAAQAELLDLHRMGDWLARGDGALVHYLVGSVLTRYALEGFRDLARSPGVSQEALRASITELDRLAIRDDGFADAIRADFECFSLPILARLPDDKLETLVEACIQIHILNCIDVDLELAGVSRETVESFKAPLLAILKGHPKTLDKRATVRLLSQACRVTIEDCGRAWNKQTADAVPEITREISAWPKVLRLQDSVFDDVDPISDEFFRRVKAVSKLTAEDLRPIRAQLARVSNPLGKAIVAHTYSSRSYTYLPFIDKTQVIGTQVVLATRLYLDKHGRLPPHLRAILGDKLMPRDPIDPFSGELLHYSSDRGLIWSVGPDGKDNGGHEEKDICWKLPSAK